jgi:hypothetical protein
MARVRRARALAMAGDATRSQREMAAGIGGLDESVGARDPRWAWWIQRPELMGHKGAMLMSLGQAGQAVECFREARRGALRRDTDRTRAHLFNSAAELGALAATRQWTAASEVLEGIAPGLSVMSSGLVRSQLHAPVRAVRRDAPPWLVERLEPVEAHLREHASGRSGTAP